MTLSSFGKGIGALGWAVSPTRLRERSRGLRAACSTCGGNLSAIVIGYIMIEGMQSSRHSAILSSSASMVLVK